MQSRICYISHIFSLFGGDAVPNYTLTCRAPGTFPTSLIAPNRSYLRNILGEEYCNEPHSVHDAEHEKDPRNYPNAPVPHTEEDGDLAGDEEDCEGNSDASVAPLGERWHGRRGCGQGRVGAINLVGVVPRVVKVGAVGHGVASEAAENWENVSISILRQTNALACGCFHFGCR
jgi:hypothetical protein